MKSAGKNHPWERIFIGRDEISGRESSLRENFYLQGWNQRERIILEREFISAGMKSARKNHPWERIYIRRDEISGEESSMGENFYLQRWNQRGRIIPECEEKLSIEQIANYLDFSSQSHFTAVFRKAVGTTPAIWRKEHKESNSLKKSDFEISIPDTEKWCGNWYNGSG